MQPTVQTVGRSGRRASPNGAKELSDSTKMVMNRVTNRPVYNSPILKMLSSVLRLPASSICVLAILLLAPHVFATDWSGPEQQLAGKIASATGPGAFAINVVNRSSLSPSQAEEIRRGLLSNLSALGVRPTSADAAAGSVSITLSEGLQNYVWVAEIHQGSNEAQVQIVSLPRPDVVSADRAPFPLTIHKTLLWTDDSRILDVALFSVNPQQMIVLGAESINLYQFQQGRWQRQESLAILHAHPWPRDLRGRLALRNDHLFDAYLPGVFCRSTTATPLAINCYDSDDPWPLGPPGTDTAGESAFFASTRNFFTGAISPAIGKQTTTQPFYSAAMVPREKYALWLIDGVDGQIHLLDGITNRIAGKLDWGSDIAGVHSGCGLGWQIVVTSNGDTPGDTVKAFEIPDREFVAVSQPLEFAGRITALWTNSDGNATIAISQNAETGKYEADQLSITCGQ
jgi:hypothetical protein